MRLSDWRWWLGYERECLQGPSQEYTITVVIPAYNEELTIRDTIDSIRAQRGAVVDEIIVVDDCSSDRTGDVSREAGVKVIRTETNQGTKAMAQNYVLSHVWTDLVVTIDADTLLGPDAVAKTLRYFNDPKTASVCGFVVPQKIETVWERGRFIEYLFGIALFKSAQNHMGAVLVSSGCFSVFRTQLLNEFGGFQQRTMAEDMDLTWDFANAGYHIYCEPEAYCYPLDPPTGRIFVSQVDRWTRSFFQNIAIHSFRSNKTLGAFVYWYLFEALLGPVVLLLVLGTLIEDFPYAILLTLGIELLVVAIPCLWKGRRIGLFWKTVASLPSYFVIKGVNFYIFWRSLYREWIIKDRLMVWEKGH